MKKLTNKVGFWDALVVTGALALGALAFSNKDNQLKVRDLYENISPSKENVEFQEKYGIPFTGGYQLARENGQLEDIIKVMNIEKRSKDFDLDFLKVRYNLGKDVDGNYQVKGEGVLAEDGVCLKKDCFDETIHHEIKHDKTYDVIKEHPSFLLDWVNIANRGLEGSAYVGEKWKEKLDSDDFVSNGFISAYSMSNELEDIAVLCAFAESNPNTIANDYFKNDKIKDKLDLASRVGLVPTEFTDYMKMSKKLKKVYGEELSREDYFAAVDSFLVENPASIYESGLKYQKAELIDMETAVRTKRMKPELMGEQLARKVDQQIDLYKDVLKSDFKREIEYYFSLGNLGICNLKRARVDGLTEKESSEYRDKAIVYFNAQEEFDRRKSAGDMNLTSVGVNDYLSEKGIDLK